MESLLGSSGKDHGWNKILESVTGWDTENHFLPAIPAALVIYMSIFLIGLGLYTLTKLLVPVILREYVLDFVKTMTFCAYPFGHDIMRSYYGEPGYMAVMVPVIFVTLLALRSGDGNPLSVWSHYFRGSIPLWKCVLKTVIQIVAGFAAFRLGMYVLALELHPMYVSQLKDYYQEFCSTDLKVPTYVGFFIEFLAVIYDSWFDGQTFTGHLHIDTVIKIINSGLLVVAGVHLTGMYMHPSMATGHTWGCGDTSRTEHIMIYWVGPIIGTWISMHLLKRFSLRRKGSRTHKPNSEQQSVSHKHNGIAVTNSQSKKQRNGKRKFFHY